MYYPLLVARLSELGMGGADILSTKEMLIQAKSYMRNWICQIPKKQPCPEIKYNGGEITERLYS